MKIREWACLHDFRVVLGTREQFLKSENTKVTVLECSSKGCEFYLDFRSNHETSNKYKLSKSYNKHNHELKLGNGALEITSEILETIKVLRCITNDPGKIAKNINQKFQKTFDTHIIRYQLLKAKNEDYGSPAQNAHKLMEILEKDKQKRSIFFEKCLSRENKLENFCFMSKRMITLANKFSDVLIVDTTFKTNRFGMPLLDIICINNLGKSCTIFVALLSNSKYESFKWAFEEFKKNLQVIPGVIFSDEEEALRKSKLTNNT